MPMAIMPTIRWVGVLIWVKYRRLLEPIGHVPPAELGLAYHPQYELALTA